MTETTNLSQRDAMCHVSCGQGTNGNGHLNGEG